MTKQRGRPRQFDEAKAKAAIMRAFWEKGFAATSIDDLTEATGLVRPSLYGAFGDKEAMYLMSLELFTGMMDAAAGTALEKADSLEEALGGFFRGLLDVYFAEGSDVSLGCMLFATAIAEAPDSRAVQAKLRSQLDVIEEAMCQSIKRLCADAPAETIAMAVTLAVSTLHSIAVSARLGRPRSELQAMADRAVAAILQMTDQ